MPAPRINGVVETCLYSNHLADSIAFYRDLLGFRVLESGERLCVFSVADKQVLIVFRSGGTASRRVRHLERRFRRMGNSFAGHRYSC